MIALNDLSVGYPSRRLLEGVNASFPEGALVALIGRNGSGKSTLLKTIAGLLPPLHGDVLVDGSSVSTLRPDRKARLLAYVSTARIRVAGMRCVELVGLGRAPFTNWLGTLSNDDRRIVDGCLEMTGMQGFANRTIDTLSDGELQRVMVARALAQETPVMLLDEPTSFLDLPGRYRLGALLNSVAREGKTVVFSTHELDIALSSADVVALICADGRLCAMPTADMARSGLLEKEFAPLPFKPTDLLPAL